MGAANGHGGSPPADQQSNVADSGEVDASYHKPVWLIQRAWSQLRVPALQRRVDEVIAELHSRAAGDADAHPSLAFLPGGRDPVADALDACVAELRDACAMDGAEAELARCGHLIRGYATAHSHAWRAAFEVALDQHRRAASRLLSTSLNARVPAQR